MTFEDRFFGRVEPRDAGGLPVSNKRLTDGPCLQVLFPALAGLDEAALTGTLREWFPRELTGVKVELHEVPPTPPSEKAPHGLPGIVAGLVGWGPHVIRLVAAGNPMPEAATVRAVRAAHYDQAIKDEAFRHTAHVLVVYSGYHPDPFEQYVVTAAVAAAVARFGAVVVANETSVTSVPAQTMFPDPRDQGDMLNMYRVMPIPFLFAGFIRLEQTGVPGVWMRTCGCQSLKLPNFALNAVGHDDAQAAFEMFSNILAYVRESGVELAPGHTLQLGEGQFFRLRAPTEHEPFLNDGVGSLLVIEPAPTGNSGGTPDARTQ